MAMRSSFACHGTARNFVMPTASRPPMNNPAGHHAWQATIRFVFSVL